MASRRFSGGGRGTSLSRRCLPSLLCVAIAALAGAACASSNSTSHGAGADAGSLATYGDSGATDGFVAPSDDATPVLTLGDSGLPAFAGCATTTQQATLAPLDLYFMLDTSGSMDDLVAAGQSKWSAVVAAMKAFVGAPAAAGVGVGMQYFPLTAAGVPSSCTTSAQCGSAGPCLLAICSGVQQTLPCNTSADCPRRSACVAVGTCQNDPNYLCAYPGASQCGSDPNGFPLGACNVITSSACVLGDSCAAQDYQTPAVAIALLPGVAPAVTASLAARSPQGNTPTSAALQGAVDEAAAYARANPGHRVVAVLATDGIPDECAPTVTAVAQIAAAGLAGTPSVKTFAIGVFTPSDVASGTAAL